MDPTNTGGNGGDQPSTPTPVGGDNAPAPEPTTPAEPAGDDAPSQG